MEQRNLPTRSMNPLPGRPAQETNLADILERVLDKGIVIAGDIQINLLDIELLTIKLRLLIASVDRAREMGINWWESDTSLQRIDDGGSNGRQLEQVRQRNPDTPLLILGVGSRKRSDAIHQFGVTLFTGQTTEGRLGFNFIEFLEAFIERPIEVGNRALLVALSGVNFRVVKTDYRIAAT